MQDTGLATDWNRAISNSPVEREVKIDKKVKIQEYKDTPQPEIFRPLNNPNYEPTDDLKFLEMLRLEKLEPYGNI